MSAYYVHCNICDGKLCDLEDKLVAETFNGG